MKSTFFTEEIRGNVAFVYHRTGKWLSQNQLVDLEEGNRDTIIQNFLTSFVDEGIKKNPGMYGPPAVYNTYTLKSQLQSYMTGYGKIIIKSYTKINKILCFDKPVAGQLYTKNFSRIIDQLLLFGIDSIKTSDMSKYIKDADTHPTDYSATYAQAISNLPEFRTWVEQGKIQGLIYTGSHDGNCLITYDDSILVPVAFCVATTSEKLDTPWYKLPKGTAFTKRSKAVQEQKYVFDLADSRIKKIVRLNNALAEDHYEEIDEMLKSKYITTHYNLSSSYANDSELIFHLIPNAPIEFLKELFETYSVGINTIAKNKIKDSILIAAVRHHRLDLIEYLLKFKVLQINYVNNSGESAPYLAISIPSTGKILNALLKDTRTRFDLPLVSGGTLWKKYLDASNGGDEKIFELLQKNDFNLKDGSRGTN